LEQEIEERTAGWGIFDKAGLDLLKFALIIYFIYFTDLCSVYLFVSFFIFIFLFVLFSQKRDFAILFDDNCRKC
jgi:hypothetical protein